MVSHSFTQSNTFTTSNSKGCALSLFLSILDHLYISGGVKGQRHHMRSWEDKHLRVQQWRCPFPMLLQSHNLNLHNLCNVCLSLKGWNHLNLKPRICDLKHDDKSNQQLWYGKASLGVADFLSVCGKHVIFLHSKMQLLTFGAILLCAKDLTPWFRHSSYPENRHTGLSQYKVTTNAIIDHPFPATTISGNSSIFRPIQIQTNR